VHIGHHSRFIVALVVASTAWGCSSSSYASGPSATPPAQSNRVDALPSLAFNPGAITVHVGDTVTFAFGSVAHNVFFDRVAGAPADITGSNANTSAARVFTAAGQYAYECHIHPGMRGTVNVTTNQ
jgi:plastocyanin